MRRYFSLLVAMIVVLLGLSSTVQADMNLPTYQVGDEWVFDVNVNVQDVILAGEWTFTVEGEESISGHNVYNLSLEGSGPATLSGIGTGDYVTEGSTFLRKSDLAALKEDVKVNVSVTFGTIDVFVDFYMNISYDPPQDQFDFPIKTDDTWSSTSTVTSSLTIVSSMLPTNSTETTVILTTEFECESKEMVSVPAGDFQSYKIKMTEEDGNYTYTYMSTRTGYMTKMQMFESTGASLGNINLKSYSYTPPVTGNGDDPFKAIMDYLWLIVLIIVIVVIVVIVLIAMSKRSKKEQTPPPGQEPSSEPEEPQAPPP
jgi:hypothetical protein